jgi:hypothetical protein
MFLEMIIVFAALAAASAVQFRTSDVQDMIRWGAGFFFSWLMVTGANLVLDADGAPRPSPRTERGGISHSGPKMPGAEYAVRAALGANRRNILALVLYQAARMTVAGAAAGTAASFRLTRLLTAELYGVKASDPVTFAAVPVILLAVAVAAACIPGLRATRLDPSTALRHE